MIKYQVKGVNGQLFVTDNSVKIEHKGILGVLTNGLAGTKVIPFKAIQGIQVKYGTNFTNGYIQFITHGKIESTGGIFKATKDENTVFFKKNQNDEVWLIQDFLERNVLQYEV